MSADILENAARRILAAVGEVVERPGLVETPARAARAWLEFTRGYTQDPADVLKVFEDGAQRVDQMVIVKDIPVFSLCEHHLVPFFGVAHVGYIPSGRVVGLSKFARLVDVFAKRLQVQERLTQQIANALMEHVRPIGAGVVVECRHLCMEMRGVQRVGSKTRTQALTGAILEDARARSEFLEAVQ